ncbi:MAG TPA: hypothetical protein VF421_11600 [Niabella sp.]
MKILLLVIIAALFGSCNGSPKEEPSQTDGIYGPGTDTSGGSMNNPQQHNNGDTATWDNAPNDTSGK